MISSRSRHRALTEHGRPAGWASSSRSEVLPRCSFSELEMARAARAHEACPSSAQVRRRNEASRTEAMNHHTVAPRGRVCVPAPCHEWHPFMLRAAAGCGTTPAAAGRDHGGYADSGCRIRTEGARHGSTRRVLIGVYEQVGTYTGVGAWLWPVDWVFLFGTSDRVQFFVQSASTKSSLTEFHE
ncbi:hypothetical protein BS78_03G375300 [Paspalum vaginatum]|nr:hypothetical protein BS78_03G375300 [Paspalum vaginatum]